MKDKIKNFVNDHKDEAVKIACLAVGSVVVYTYVCKKKGYRMVKPAFYTEEAFYVRTLTGKTMHVNLHLNKK